MFQRLALGGQPHARTPQNDGDEIALDQERAADFRQRIAKPTRPRIRIFRSGRDVTVSRRNRLVRIFSAMSASAMTSPFATRRLTTGTSSYDDTGDAQALALGRRPER